MHVPEEGVPDGVRAHVDSLVYVPPAWRLPADDVLPPLGSLSRTVDHAAKWRFPVEETSEELPEKATLADIEKEEFAAWRARTHKAWRDCGDDDGPLPPFDNIPWVRARRRVAEFEEEGSESAALVRRVLQARDHFEALSANDEAELARGRMFDAAEEQRRWKTYSKLLHPDKNGARGAEEAQKRVNQAHDELKDPAARRKYESTLPPRTRRQTRRGPARGGALPHRYYAASRLDPHAAWLGPSYARSC